MNVLKAALLAFAISLIAAAYLLLFSPQQEATSLSASGSASAIELGFAQDYGYATFSHSGSGSVRLIALSEKPKTNIIILKTDFLNTERYSYLVDIINPLAERGFTISEVEEIRDPENSILIIPSGAMPASVLERLDNLSSTNKIIYIGKTNLMYYDRLIQENWPNLVSNSTKEKLIIIEETLEEFYFNKNYSIIECMEANCWAAANSAVFPYSGEGNSTVFIQLRNASYLRMLPLADSKKSEKAIAQISGNSDIFPWERASLTVNMNYSSGNAQYQVEKDGAMLSQGDLDRVRGAEAFFIPLRFEDPGDYLVRITDMSGTIGAMRVHVKNLSVSFSRAYGNAYEFLVFLDGKPLNSVEASIALNHSNNSVDAVVRNGKLAVRANLREGENVFLISLYGHQNSILYLNSQEGMLTFYAKYISVAFLMFAAFFIVARMSRRPTYKINIPEGASVRNMEVKLMPADVIASMQAVEKQFGWKDVPLYAKEIGIGLKRLTNGMDTNEGNVESIMKKLEEKGMAKSHLGLYGLPKWGDPKANAIKRIVRDKLIEAGLEFSECESGFVAGELSIVLDPESASGEAIVVFEDSEARRSYLFNLDRTRKARLDLKANNSVLRLATLDELDELL